MRFAMSDPTEFLGGRTDFTQMAGANQQAGYSTQAVGLESNAKTVASNLLTDARVDAQDMLGGAMEGAVQDGQVGQMASTIGSIGGSILGEFKLGGAFNPGQTMNKGNAYDIGYSLGSMWN